MTKYQYTKQVTGLLFCSSNDKNHPDLLGQWIGASKSCDLEEGEQIVDLVVITTKPTFKSTACSGLSQVEGITVVTNRRRINWGSGAVQVCGGGLIDVGRSEHRLSEVVWEFNAIFDRVRCIYRET